MAKSKTPSFVLILKLNTNRRDDKILNDTYQGEYEPSRIHPGRLTVKARTHIAMNRCAEFLAFIEAAEDAAGEEA